MHRTSRPVISAAAAALGAIILAACAPSDPSPSEAQASAADLQREPAPAAAPPAVDPTGLRLPLQFDGSGLLETGWEVPPQHLEGIFLAPVETDGHLTFTAIDSDGTPLWTLERPLACAGFTLATTDAGQPLAIINDASASPDRISTTTASAYDLRTGDKAWGPMEVPGPHQGPGLVYAEPAAAMGETGPRTALDVNTGEIAAESPHNVVAERDGIVLLQEADALRAIDSAGASLWEADLPAGIDRASSPPGSQLKAGLISLSTEPDRSVIIDLATGDIVADGVASAALDEATGVLVVTDGVQTWAVQTETGDVMWERAASPDTRIWSAGTAQVYIREGDAIHVHNALTGDVGPGYEEAISGTITVPRTIAASGAAALDIDGELVLATTPTLE